MYYGPEEVERMEDVDSDPTMKKLFLKSGKSFEITQYMAAVSLTETPNDYTKLRDLQCYPVVAEILAVLLKWSPRVEDVDHIVTQTVTSLNHNINRANAFLWGKEMYEKTVKDVDNVLLQIPKTPDNSGNEPVISPIQIDPQQPNSQ